MIFSSKTILLSLSTRSFSALSNKNLSSCKDISLFIFGLFLIYLARLPNLRVEMVSASLYIDGLHVIIKHVLELPPKDSYRTLVSLESL